MRTSTGRQSPSVGDTDAVRLRCDGPNDHRGGSSGVRTSSRQGDSVCVTPDRPSTLGARRRTGSTVRLLREPAKFLLLVPAVGLVAHDRGDAGDGAVRVLEQRDSEGDGVALAVGTLMTLVVCQCTGKQDFLSYVNHAAMP